MRFFVFPEYDCSNSGFNSEPPTYNHTKLFAWGFMSCRVLSYGGRKSCFQSEKWIK